MEGKPPEDAQTATDYFVLSFFFFFFICKTNQSLANDFVPFIFKNIVNAMLCNFKRLSGSAFFKLFIIVEV